MFGLIDENNIGRMEIILGIWWRRNEAKISFKMAGSTCTIFLLILTHVSIILFISSLFLFNKTTLLITLFLAYFYSPFYISIYSNSIFYTKHNIRATFGASNYLFTASSTQIFASFIVIVLFTNVWDEKSNWNAKWPESSLGPCGLIANEPFF